MPASQADLHNDAGLTERVVAAREAEIIERMIDRQERAPIKHRALPRTETVKPVASDERRWLMPTGRIRWPFITLNPALSMLLNMSLCNLLLAGDDAVLWVGIALEGPDTLIVERCAEREKHARRVNSAGGITGGTYYRYELQAAGWQPGRYLVEIVDGVAVARKDRRAE